LAEKFVFFQMKAKIFFEESLVNAAIKASNCLTNEEFARSTSAPFKDRTKKLRNGDSRERKPKVLGVALGERSDHCAKTPWLGQICGFHEERPERICFEEAFARVVEKGVRQPNEHLSDVDDGSEQSHGDSCDFCERAFVLLFLAKR